jgi:hypothetical protein
MVEHRLHQPRDQLHALGRDVRRLEDIVGAAERDVSVHFLHARQLDIRMRRVLLLLGAKRHFARHARPVDLHVRIGAPLARRTDQRDHDRVRHVERIDQHAFAFFQRGRKAREAFGQLSETGIDNHERGQ